MVRIAVKTATGATVATQDLDPATTTLEELLVLIATQNGMNVEDQVLLYGGARWTLDSDGDKTLHALGLTGEGGEALHTVVVQHCSESSTAASQPSASAPSSSPPAGSAAAPPGAPQPSPSSASGAKPAATSTPTADVALSEAERRVLELFGASPDTATPAPTTTTSAPTASPAGSAMSAQLQEQLDEAMRQREIDENLINAIEYYPEFFGSITMLYIPVEVNGVPFKAFVDSGAQKSIISAEAVERSNLGRLVDRRRQLIMQGVGEQRSIGEIYLTPVKVGSLFLPFSFTVLQNNAADILLGLDLLRRHQMVIDLIENVLRIGDEAVPFLPESEVPVRIGTPQPPTATGSAAPSSTDANAKKERKESTPPAHTEHATAGGAPSSSSPSGASVPTTSQRFPPSLPPALSAAVPPVQSATGSSLPIPPPLPPAPASSSVSPAPPAGAVPPASGGGGGGGNTTREPSEEEKMALLTQFMNFTGISSTDDAATLLEAANWSLDLATQLLYDDE